MFPYWLFIFPLFSLLIFCSKKKKLVKESSRSAMMTAKEDEKHQETGVNKSQEPKPKPPVKVAEKKTSPVKVDKKPAKKETSSNSSLSEKTGISVMTSREMTGKIKASNEKTPDSQKKPEKTKQQEKTARPLTIEKQPKTETKKSNEDGKQTIKTGVNKSNEDGKKTIKTAINKSNEDGKKTTKIGEMEVAPEVADLVRKGELLPPNDCATVDDIESQWNVPIDKSE